MPPNMNSQPLFMMTEDTNDFTDEFWYMSKMCRAGVEKVPTYSHVGSKRRYVVDILGLNFTNVQMELPERRVVDSDAHKKFSRSATKPWAELFTDKPDMTENLTLKEMKLLLKKTPKRSSGTVTATDLNNHSNPSDSSESYRSVENCKSSRSLELLWEDSASNSSDNFSLQKSISSILLPSLQQQHEVVSQSSMEGKVEECATRRKSLNELNTVLNEDAAEDDDWTLEKWKRLLKQGASRKKMRTVCKVDGESPKDALANSPLCDVESQVPKLQGTHKDGLHDRDPVACCITSNGHMDSSVSMSLYGNPSNSNRASPVGPNAQAKSSLMPSSSSVTDVCLEELEEESELTTQTEISCKPDDLHVSKSVRMPSSCDTAQSKSLLEIPSGLNHGKSVTLPVSDSLLGKVSSMSNCKLDGRLSGSHGKLRTVLSSEGDQSQSGLDPSRLKLCRTDKSADSTDACGSAHAIDQVLRIDGDNLHISGTSVLQSEVPEESQGPSEGSAVFRSEDTIVNHVLKVRMSHVAEVSTSLNCNENMDAEEEEELQKEPAKIPRKRKAISPISQEFLLKASKLTDSGHDSRVKGSRGWIDVIKLKRTALSLSNATSCGRMIQAGDFSQAPGYWKKAREALSDGLSNSIPVSPPKGKSEPSSVWNEASSGSPLAGKCVSPPDVTNASVSPPLGRYLAEPFNVAHQKMCSPNRGFVSTSPSGCQSLHKFSNPSPTGIHPKGILRSNSPACQGLCSCEECSSLRSRAEKASEFSQRQMQDIEGLAVKLLKDLSTLRNIVEVQLIQSPRNQWSRMSLNLDQLRKVTNSALEAEEKAKKQLVRMARDCNRYCKIMRMQGRKLTFADESGGNLCQVKVFHPERALDHNSQVTANSAEVVCLPSLQGGSSAEVGQE
ncbi:hypothetical protein KP509_35G043300 [Ceratopteris richardii]|uniref:Uncharacterized protein n=1 Tax=Ceratopteris richardii TaxID=49495 RepID=A0A8T2QGD7_CERRI|nr:hypothetical protein KP509_35G043300 [Ceratopteris richardii]KAH7282679.1 hypothetical protein KP509_35G043300 [Ceratopteris richardii]KAH7282680.1 hypothetical protein KP509_35G043300 [Ceratopteris richardii]